MSRTGKKLGRTSAVFDDDGQGGDASEDAQPGDAGYQTEPPGAPNADAPPSEFPTPIPSSELRARSDDLLWRLHGILSTDGITLFTALWKSGKSTWLGYLYRAFADAEEFCGLEVKPSKVLNVTEESESVLAMRRDKIGWRDNVRHLVTDPQVAGVAGLGFGMVNHLHHG